MNHDKIIREIKLNILMGKEFPKPDTNRLHKMLYKNLFGFDLKFLDKKIDDTLYQRMKELSKFGVISGSSVLKLLGVIDREIGDIDVIVIDEKKYEEFIKNKEEISHGHYGLTPDIDCMKTIEYDGCGYNNYVDFIIVGLNYARYIKKLFQRQSIMG